jgi:hypothetical protein
MVEPPKDKPTNTATRLTPDEIAALRADKRDALRRLKEIRVQQARDKAAALASAPAVGSASTRLTPEGLTALRQHKREMIRQLDEIHARKVVEKPAK